MPRAAAQGLRHSPVRARFTAPAGTPIGGLGGLLLATVLGFVKGLTSTYAAGLLVFALAGACAMLAIVCVGTRMAYRVNAYRKGGGGGLTSQNVNGADNAVQRYMGIDYSGAKTPNASLKGLHVYLAEAAAPPIEVQTPLSQRKYWTRRGIAEWLVERLAERYTTLVGIDHGFSFPLQFAQRTLPV